MSAYAAHGRAPEVGGNGAHHSLLDGWGMFQDWEELAACQDSPIELWFGDRPDGLKKSVRTSAQTKAAKAICARCPVLDDCREWVMEVKLPHGVVGGMTEAERRRLLAKGETAWRMFWYQQDLATGRTGFNRYKTHCPHGHEYTPENTHLYRGSRYCIACRNRRKQEYRLRQREQLGHWPWEDQASTKPGQAPQRKERPTHCPRGHAYSITKRGDLRCRTCDNLRAAEYRKRMREQLGRYPSAVWQQRKRQEARQRQAG